MNFITKICLALFLFACSLNAYYYDFQFRLGAYYPTSHQATKAFKRGVPVYQLEGSVMFMNAWEWIPWKAWANASLMLGHGFADNLGRTSSNINTISIGLKHSWIIDCFQGACCYGNGCYSGGTFYLGAGPSLSWLRIKSHKVIPEGFWDGHWHGHRKIAKKNFGAVIKSGFQFRLWECVLVDVFADYSIIAFHYKNLSKKHLFPRVDAVNKIHKFRRKDGHHRLDLGGFVVGGAIGVPF